jgi:hypothetical protein
VAGWARVHVRQAALVATLVALAGLAPLACDAPAAKGDLKARALEASVAAQDEALVRASRRARDAAAVLAGNCHMTYSANESAFTLYDECNSSSALSEMSASAALLRDVAGPLSLRGPAAMFVDQVRLFTEWAELVRDLPKRGTLAHYQEVALAWNAWRPTEPIAPDPVPAKYPSWYGIRDAGGDAEADAEAGLLAWERCPIGACIVKPPVTQ